MNIKQFPTNLGFSFGHWRGRGSGVNCLAVFPAPVPTHSKLNNSLLKLTSAEALTSLQWVPLHARRFGHRCCLVQDAMKGEIPEHLDVFKSTMSQQHGYNTRNGYMPVISKPRTEWGKNKTYYKAITDWASLPSELKKLMPKRIFKYKLKQFLLDYF